MKSVLLSIGFVFTTVLAFADDVSSTASISQAFVHQSGKDNVYVLQLKEDGSYDYSRYTNRRMYHDFGVFSVHHNKITFESRNRKHGFNSVAGKTYYISKKGIFDSRMKATFGKKPMLNATSDPVYMNSWEFNPITGKTIAEMEAEKAAKAKPKMSTEQRNKMLSAFTKKFYLSETDSYAPEYKPVLERSYCGPDCYVKTVAGVPIPWNYDTTKSALVNDYGRVIYESTHAMNSMSYLVVPGIEIPVSQGNTFNSAEFKKLVPADAPAKLSHYKMFVSDSSLELANLQGMYGLMNEFSSYENATRASVIAARNAMSMNDTAAARSFLTQAADLYYTYYEFKLYMGWYLHYAKQSHPDVFASMMANNNLRVAYTLIDQEFANTIEDMKSAGKDLGEGSSLYTANESAYAAYPKQQLAKEKNYLSNFAAKNVTRANYLSHLQ